MRRLPFKHTNRSPMVAGALATALLGTACGLTPAVQKAKQVGQAIPPGCNHGGAIDPSPSCVAKLGKITLAVTDTENATSAQQNAINQAFMREYPNITIRRQKEAGPLWLQPGNRIIFALASKGSSPDVSEADQSQATWNRLIRAGLVSPLDTLAKAYGWTQDLAPAATVPNRAAANGSHPGSGSLYAVSPVVSMEGWYYNKKVLARLGGRVPTTVAQFNALLAQAKAHGVPGIQQGDSDQSASQMLPTLAFSSTLPTRTFQELSTFDLPGGSALKDGGLQAGSLLKTWGSYLPAGYRGYNGDDAISRFSSGQGLLFPSGDWMIPIFAKSLGSNFGFFLPPRLGAGPRSAPFGAGGAWLIPTNSKHPLAAAVYLNFMTSTQVAKIIAANDAIPARRLPTGSLGARTLPAFKDLLAAADYLSKNQSGAPYQVGTDAIAEHDPTGASQAVLAGRLSPSQWLKAEEGFVSAAVASKGQ